MLASMVVGEGKIGVKLRPMEMRRCPCCDVELEGMVAVVLNKLYSYAEVR